MEIHWWLITLHDVLNEPRPFLGGLNLWAVVYIPTLLLLLFHYSGRVQGGLLRWLSVHSTLDPGAAHTVATLTRYGILFSGILVILDTAGVDVSTLQVFAGALGVGLGFGLQNVTSNFISGLIILFERPLKVGDRVEVGSLQGDVIAIGARSTTILTNDNITIVVPNTRFITDNVTNWSHRETRVRFRIPVLVHYGTDLDLVERLMMQVAAEDPDVLEDPPPGFRLLEFADSGMKLELRVWSSSLVRRPNLLRSQINQALYRRLVQNGVQLPYPHRELRGTLEIKGDSTPTPRGSGRT
ncbi:MAG: mechanosensitive ion channel [Armatimonadetes bacterium]|nr:mechanosensitive ion channel [Armatimonadota bacterium]